eukprot:TRINITY_DN20805_c0_g1_i1.p2 TRINITY_DN20805_c0_g1~~TRINITY_DN20805_c0_g1_i1.p2  ORF type:complete len:389 (+),score=157.14 TRINITY_DN20805_c0_g1_i1:36-1202(+)
MLRLFLLGLCTAAARADDLVKAMPLHNAAAPGEAFPFLGLGMGGYGLDPKVKYPECWTEACRTAQKAIPAWLEAGGVRLDDANSYYHMNATGEGMRLSGKAREDIYLLSKVGPSLSLGYQDALEQVKTMKASYQTDYVDMLLIHWPESSQQGSIKPQPAMDEFCRLHTATYDEKKCRIETWRALVKVWDEGKGFARSIGVSNYNLTHLLDIKEAGLPLPSINQVPFNPHRKGSKALYAFCDEHKILVNGYSPFGTPDTAAGSGSRGAHTYPPTVGTPTLLAEPMLQELAAAKGATVAQVLLAWHFALGRPTNPRTMDPAHMAENLQFGKVHLTEEEMARISAIPEATCDLDPTWYECTPHNGFCGPQCCTTPPCKVGADGVCCAGANP